MRQLTLHILCESIKRILINLWITKDLRVHYNGPYSKMCTKIRQLTLHISCECIKRILLHVDFVFRIHVWKSWIVMKQKVGNVNKKLETSDFLYGQETWLFLYYYLKKMVWIQACTCTTAMLELQVLMDWLPEGGLDTKVMSRQPGPTLCMNKKRDRFF